jgi:hypothetical protein
MVMSMKMAVFWVAVPRRLVQVYQCSEACTASIIRALPHHRPDDGGSKDL